MSKRFTRVIEDFECERCGTPVMGSGYTNHCPTCLWSKHVDVYPGDRAASCGGMMEPVAIEGASGDYQILHRCGVCGHEKRNGLSHYDSHERAIAIVEYNARNA